MTERDIKIKGDLLAVRRNDYTDLTVLVKSDAPNPTALDVTITGDQGYHKVIRATPNELAFVARSLKSSGAERYTVEAAGQRQSFTPTCSYQHVVLDLKRSADGKGADAGPSVHMLLPVAMAILVIVGVRQFYQQKMQRT